jgi:hypothetical protein
MTLFREFADSDKAIADEARLQLELELKDLNITDEVVVLQANSEAELRHTHGRYFKDLAGLSVMPAH